MQLLVNGVPALIEDPSDRLLLDVLRDDLALTGAKLGCGTGDCGACTVLVDGLAVNACLVHAAECDDARVETIEGVAATRAGGILIEELARSGGVQCGICIPGIIVAAVAQFPDLGAAPSAEAIRRGLAGNICRCTGYLPIVEAIQVTCTRLASEDPQ